jgi:hypothetical protein
MIPTNDAEKMLAQLRLMNPEIDDLLLQVANPQQAQRMRLI